MPTQEASSTCGVDLRVGARLQVRWIHEVEEEGADEARTISILLPSIPATLTTSPRSAYMTAKCCRGMRLDVKSTRSERPDALPLQAAAPRQSTSATKPKQTPAWYTGVLSGLADGRDGDGRRAQGGCSASAPGSPVCLLLSLVV